MNNLVFLQQEPSQINSLNWGPWKIFAVGNKLDPTPQAKAHHKYGQRKWTTEVGDRLAVKMANGDELEEITNIAKKG